MTDSIQIPVGTTCEPFPPDARARGCEGCAPVMTLSHEEEAILSRMRDLKQVVRAVADRLQEIDKFIGSGSDPLTSPFALEWKNLSSELQRLRDQWEIWEKSLEEATERKLILLGHRQPKL